MNKAHGKTLIIENNTNNTMISSMINNNNPSGSLSGNDDDGELIIDQQNMDETYFASKIVDRVACDICNKQVCNKYFLRTHKQKVHGIYESASSSGVASLHDNVQQHKVTSHPQRAYDDEEGLVDDEGEFEYEDNDGEYNMMIDEHEYENEEEFEMRNGKSKSSEYDETGKELGELVGSAENLKHAKSKNLNVKSRRMSTCSNATTTSKWLFCTKLKFRKTAF